MYHQQSWLWAGLVPISGSVWRRLCSCRLPLSFRLVPCRCRSSRRWMSALSLRLLHGAVSYVKQDCCGVCQQHLHDCGLRYFIFTGLLHQRLETSDACSLGTRRSIALFLVVSCFYCNVKVGNHLKNSLTFTVILKPIRPIFNFSNWVSKVIRKSSICALLRFVIGPEYSRHSLNQSDPKLKPITTWLHAFFPV